MTATESDTGNLLLCWGELVPLTCSTILSMRLSALLLVVLVLSGPSAAQKSASATWPTQFEIARVTHFDVGPPLDYYELFLVRPANTGTSIRRVSLTPAADQCLRTAKTEVAVGSVNESVRALFAGSNPCAIPEKKLRLEEKRCKHCMVFSFATTVMQVQCGSETRLIRAEVLDRDMFATNPKTPQYTSWTMALLKRLEDAVGPGVLDEPMLPLTDEQKSSSPHLDPQIAQDLSNGKYDALLSGGDERASAIFKDSQRPAPVPTVRLVSSTPLAPTTFVSPVYTPIAKVAHIQGAVSIRIDTDDDGNVMSVALDAGSPFLFGPTRAAATQWKFPPNPTHQEIRATLNFMLNCPSKPE